MGRASISLVAMVVALLAAGGVALAAAGDLDRAFGGDGRVTTVGDDDYFKDLISQPDGKLVVVGGTSGANSSLDFTLVRYNPNGSLDGGFGTRGRVVTDMGSSHDLAYSLTLQPGGKLLVAGTVSDDTSGGSSFAGRLALARYNPDGSLDQTFGEGGRVIGRTTLGGSVRAVVFQPDGRLVAAGVGDEASTAERDFFLARYNADGTPDETFGRGGEVTTDFFGDYDVIRDLILQPDGKLTAAGNAFGANGAPDDFALARYNADGTLDASFGGDGRVTTTVSPRRDGAAALALQPDGKLVAAGSSVDPRIAAYSPNFALVRYNPDGSLDESFSQGGRATTDFFGHVDSANALIVQPNGKLVAAGTAERAGRPSVSTFALARYNPNGVLDKTFGTRGRTTTKISSDPYDGVEALVRQPTNGKLVAGGFVASAPYASGEKFALTRYQP